MRASERYPGFARAALEIALDNGGINRHRSQEAQGRELDRWLERQEPDILSMAEEWLSGLTDEQMQAVCSGGQDEPETMELMMSAPPFTDDLLNSYFDEVC